MIQKLKKAIENEKWNNRMIPAGKAISTLDLVKYIIKKTGNISSREIIIFIDNKANLNSIYKHASKVSNVTQEASAIIKEIKQEVEDTFINITFKYANNKTRPRRTF